MSTPNIFSVAREHLGRLDATEAVEFIADLLWAEARRIGLAVTSVSISLRINVPDGGVDAEVQAGSTGGAFIRPGVTAYQVKAGEFEAWQDSKIRQELFGQNAKIPSASALGNAVAACLAKGGSYVMVCTGMDFTPEQRRVSRELVHKHLADVGFASAQVDVIGQSPLIGALEPFPSLCLALNGNGNARFQTLASWADDDQMRRDYKEGPAQLSVIEAIRGELRKHSEAVHVRVLGEAGVGKTRLVLKALAVPDLAPLVIYCDNADTPINDGLVNYILRDDNPFNVILVVDECDFDTRSLLWNKLKHKGPRIKLVTIYNEFEAAAGNIALAEVPALRAEEVLAILREYLLPSEPADRWVDFCGGSPRLAHLLGANVRTNPDDPLRPGDTVNAWNRIIAGPESFKSEDVQHRLLILEHLALFKRFGSSAPYQDEATFVAEMVGRAEPRITRPRFNAIVKVLKDRRLLQGDSTLYIASPLLHIKLWTDWWERYGSADFDLDSFEATLPGQLRDWFHEMFSYARQSSTALRVVRRILNENAARQRSDFFQHGRNARFFLALTDAAPEEALTYLQRTVGTWSAEQLRTFEGRRETVWALERIAVWRHLFAGAARILLRLAENETETFSNNATGEFAELFSPGQGPVAPTEATPEERFPILVEALTSPSADARKVALLACKSALKTGHFSRMVGAEYQGLRRPPEFWVPKTWGELFDAYRRVWNLLVERLDAMPEDERRQAVAILLQHARGLNWMANLTPMVVDTLKSLLHKPYVSRKDIIDTVEDVYRYDAKGLEPKVRSHWDDLRALLIPADFHSRMERYVGMDRWADSLDEEGQPNTKTEETIAKLAREAFSHPGTLTAELTWLVTDEAKNGFRFGHELGRLDDANSLLESLLDAQRQATKNASVYFLGGYFNALRERDAAEFENQLERLAQDSQLRSFVPELTWRGGLTDLGGRRVLALARARAFDSALFRMFVYGGVVRGLSEDVFHEWIDYMLELNTVVSVGTAVDLYHFYYLMGEELRALPKQETRRVLTAAPFFGESQEASRHSSHEYDWSRVAEAFVEQHPDAALDLGRTLLAHFGEDSTIISGFRPQSLASLETILELYPAELWADMARYLGPPIDSRAFRIKHWLRERALSMVPPQLVWDWIDEKIDDRAWYAAGFVPPLFPGDPTKVSARELLRKYGSRDDVRRNLIANFYSEGWSGPASAHYQGKLDALRQQAVDETDPNVLRWVTEYEHSLASQVERERKQEEREF